MWLIYSWVKVDHSLWNRKKIRVHLASTPNKYIRIRSDFLFPERKKHTYPSWLMTINCQENQLTSFTVRVSLIHPWSEFIISLCSVYMEPTELVQHFAYRRKSHRRKGAAGHFYLIFGLAIWHSGEEGGTLLYLFKRRLPTFATPR